MTDQERHHANWPSGWVEKNLPSWTRLRRNGLYFNRACTAASQCSPSRAVMLTGRFAPANRVTRTLLWPGLQHQDRLPNIATLPQAAGYEAAWKGKWHLSYAANAAPGNGGEDWRSPLTTCSLCPRTFPADISARSARATGPTPCTSASTAAASSMNCTISPTIGFSSAISSTARREEKCGANGAAASNAHRILRRGGKSA